MSTKDFLFGKKPKPETQESGNKAYDTIKNATSPALGYITGGGNMMGSLLGIPGMGNQTEALSNFANSGGMKFLLDEGTDSINSNFYARGLGQSGAAMKGLEKYRSGLASTYLNDYMKNLLGFSNLGLGAGSLLASAGQYSKGQGASQGKQGGLSTALQIASKIPGISDARVKKNIKKIGEYRNGLSKYSFEFKKGYGPEGRFEGPLAHEVREHLPAAYLPGYYGEFDGVDYAKLGN